jgi:type I restriction enzyme M protein
MNALFDQWRRKTAASLRQLHIGFHPKELIAALSEDLLAHYADKPLIDNYAVYQHLLDYWTDTMQDDCYLIAADGWKAETYRVVEKDKKGKEKDKGWACDLVPKALVLARYFAADQAAIDKFAVELESVVARMTELEEEHGGEDGAFSELDRVNKAEVTRRLKEIKHDKEVNGEAEILQEWLKLADNEFDLKKALKNAEAALDAKVYAQYPKLTEAEVKTLVVEDKWLAPLHKAIHGEMDRISQSLTQPVRELAERYETPMPKMVDRVADLEANVNRHLERMGFSWK